jgi:hypothetical protein
VEALASARNPGTRVGKNPLVLFCRLVSLFLTAEQ